MSKTIDEKVVEMRFDNKHFESNVQTKPMEQVSIETNVPIFPKKIYADEIGTPGSEVDSYLKLLQYNLAIIIEGLSSGGN